MIEVTNNVFFGVLFFIVGIGMFTVFFIWFLNRHYFGRQWESLIAGIITIIICFLIGSNAIWSWLIIK